MRMTFLSALALLTFAGTSPADDASPLARAQRLVDQKPTVAHWIGLAEMQRTTGQAPEALETLRHAVETPEGRDDEGLRAVRCWRMLPVGLAERDDFRKQVAQLKTKEAPGGWAGVYSVYLAWLDGDREALIAAASDDKIAPKAFPTDRAEKAHLELLLELGAARTPASLEVVAGRAYKELYALRDLDRGLTREAAFLRTAHREDAAKTLEACQGRLRQSYLASSRRLVERLFALNLLDQAKDRAALLADAQTIPYLNDRQKMEQALARLDEAQAWKLVIEPLLSDEVGLIQAPPDLAKVKAPAAAELVVQSDRKTARDGAAVYEGKVRASVGPLRIDCDRLSLVRDGDAGPASLAGSGAVLIEGLPGFPGGVRADRFTFSTDVGAFTLGGDVRLSGPAGVMKLRACTVSRAGAVADRRSLLDDFHEADTTGRLELLPRIGKVYEDDELSGEVRYLLALTLLRPHLTWHAPYATPKRDEREDRLIEKQQEISSSDDGRWTSAHGGEDWMLSDVPQEAKAALRKLLEATGGDELEKKPRGNPAFFWHIKDREHPDVARALRLLESVKDGPEAGRALRWRNEIARNNTVLTFDVTGGYALGQNAPVVLDARAADAVTFKLYRVGKPEDLLWVEDRIGQDFVYHDHGLQYGDLKWLRQEELRDEAKQASALRVKVALNDPDFLKQAPTQRWEVRPADLRTLPSATPSHFGRHDRDDEDPEAEYFGDACEQFRQRLDKAYWPSEGDISSWQCDRVFEVPGKALAEPGAYILTVEANGETACAPLLVDPLSLTLRRCRDGVFGLVSDQEGRKPIAGAHVIGKEMLGDAVADAEGAAFARLYAAGDRAVIAYKDGRYAVGGFGRVFDGIYVSPLDAQFRGRRWGRDIEKLAEAKQSVRYYADRCVVAALTDRPTYRPGQEVQFKLIVRRLAQDAKVPDDGRPIVFRAEDFELTSNLRVPANGARVPYEVIDPKGRVVAEGTLTLNDFGTAADKAVLNAEAAVGAYTLRVKAGDAWRIVPDVFAVRYYRVPNFQIEINDLPEKLKEGQELTITLSGSYYFGKPVAGGHADVRLVRPDEWKALAEAQAVLDEAGKATIKLTPSKKLAGGKYLVVCALTDDGGRTVSRSAPLGVDGPTPTADGLSTLPHFIAVGAELPVATLADTVVAEQWLYDAAKQADASRRFSFPVKDGKAVVKPPAPGWYTLTAGSDETEVFVYGDKGDPFKTWTKQEEDQRKEKQPEETHRKPRKQVARWVDLSHYRSEEDGDAQDGPQPRPPLLALFDKRQARVGDKLRVLVYTPGGDSRLVFTMEGWTVVDYFVAGPFAEAGDYHVIDVPIKLRHLPNFYLQGEILSNKGLPSYGDYKHREVQERKKDRQEDAGEDPLWCRVDVIDPNPAPGGETLKVEVKTDRKQYKPGDQVDVELHISGRDGKPREAEASLAAVDEGVFSFGEDRAAGLARQFSDPHPVQRYVRKTWRSSQGDRWVIEKKRLEEWKNSPIQRVQDLEKMMQEAKAAQSAMDGLSNLAPAPPLLEGEPPVASVPLEALRTDFRETAAWLPQLRTGADGVARASFHLPDSLTEFRLTALALTKETEIGLGRTSVQSTLPLAVQLLLPRFAVEKDHLSAVGLLHNNGPKDRGCDVTWEIEGAAMEGSDAPLEGWNQEDAGGKTVAHGRLNIPAGKSARIGLKLEMDHIGAVKVVLRCNDGADGDAETRGLTVQPLGRDRDVFLNGDFQGSQKVKLPAGFTARDLHIVVARGDVAQALEGVGGLVDYPYGCVEQTMSRFLPAVMVKHATREAALRLPSEVAARLPDVLNKGLTRLYAFQHEDGGWGWWEHDATDPRMTAYVVYGLARCRLAGEPVDPVVLTRGCAWLRQQLADGKLVEPTAARAWLALALAGQVDASALDRRAAEAIESPETRSQLALGCRAAGLQERGERLWASVRDWKPESVPALALKLRVALAFGAPLEECQAGATRLVALRSGLGWGDTQTTADAIDALAGMTGYIADKAPARSVRIVVGDKVALDVKDAADLKRLVYRVHLAGDRLPTAEGVEIEMVADCDEKALYTVVASGVQRLDKVEPVGKEIKVSRRLETPDGKPLEGKVRVGQVFAVRLNVDLEKPADYVLLEDRRPAGCEYADERIARQDSVVPANVEFRDDRMCVFYSSLSAGRHEIVYYLRAETPGASHMLPACMFPMYAPTVRGETDSTVVEVEAAKP